MDHFFEFNLLFTALYLRFYRSSNSHQEFKTIFIFITKETNQQREEMHIKILLLSDAFEFLFCLIPCVCVVDEEQVKIQVFFRLKQRENHCAQFLRVKTHLEEKNN